jgi:inner membrane protein
MQWWSWIAAGVILLGAELTFVNAQFYLVFIGGASLLVGLLVALGLGIATWLQWLIFILTSLFGLIGFRGRLYQRLRVRLPDLLDGLSGEIVHVPCDLAAGAECRLEYRGSSWEAQNAGESRIAAGSSARIERVEGLKLYLRASA